MTVDQSMVGVQIQLRVLATLSPSGTQMEPAALSANHRPAARLSTNERPAGMLRLCQL